MGGRGYSPPATLATLLNGTLFPPNSGGDPRSDAHQSQIIGGDADVDHTQIIGGIQSNYWGGYIPPGFGTPGCSRSVWFFPNPKRFITVYRIS